MYRNELISSCLSRTNNLIAQTDSNDSRRKTFIFQRRQLENERNVEEIVRTNTKKVINKTNVFFLLDYLFFNFRYFMNVVEIIIHLLRLNQYFLY